MMMVKEKNTDLGAGVAVRGTIIGAYTFIVLHGSVLGW